MANSVSLRVSGALDQVRAVVEAALQPEGFRFTWDNAGQGIVEKGTRAKAMLLGAFATHYKYHLLLRPQPDGTVVVELGLATTGLSGGATGAVKLRRKLDEVGRILTTAFQSSGTLIQA
ncbi:hypothetical protein [Actinomadura coerulea]|uniref:hypothetical protein n=1 Tax=Actinomadura coerulea TaxID=46159 RepID=UPI003440739B